MSGDLLFLAHSTLTDLQIHYDSLVLKSVILTTQLYHSHFRFGLNNPYLAGAGGGKFPDLTSVTSRAALYWPGIQGLMSNPSVWRDRFVLNSKSSIVALEASASHLVIAKRRLKIESNVEYFWSLIVIFPG